MPTDTKFIKILAKQIDKLRQEKGMSFNEMALACDLEKAQVYRICKNGVNITASTIFKIAKGLDIPAQEIFDFKY